MLPDIYLKMEIGVIRDAFDINAEHEQTLSRAKRDDIIIERCEHIVKHLKRHGKTEE